MIASSGVSYSCPFCSELGDPVLHVPEQLARCQSCQFVFPVSIESKDRSKTKVCAVDAADVIVLDDETWTGKWGPIPVDRYSVVRALASGAQGRILLAHHRHLDQRCVIKLVVTEDKDWAHIANQRLRSEAQAGFRVNHPNVARVFDCECTGNSWYFVMEYVEGCNLRRLVQDVNPLPVEQVIELSRQIGSGLHAIHDAGLVHRDIKPSNLMLSHRGLVKIMDLGLVKAPTHSGSSNMTHVGQVVGTPLYMPPEQFDASDKIDARADIYAFGATVYFLLTGHPPFEGNDIADIAKKHRHEPVVWTDDDARRVPKWFREIVERCLAKRRDHRFESAAELEAAIREKTDGVSVVTERAVNRTMGLSVLAFQNLSRRPEDEWIGDAIAEYVSSRLLEFEGVHVADRGVISKVVDRTQADASGDPSGSQIMDAARLAGVGHVIVGSFQRQGDDIRIIAKKLEGRDGNVVHLGTVSGAVESLFDLEDRITERIVEALGPVFAGERRRRQKKSGPSNLEAQEKLVRGQRAFADGDYQAAVAYAGEAAALDPDCSDPISLMGACYARLGDYDRAVQCHHQQERRASKDDDISALAEALGNLGAMYYYKGEYAVAYDFLVQATALGEREDQTPDSAKLHANLGMVLMRLEKPEEALGAFERAIEICKRFNDLVSMVWPYNGMGSVLLKQGRYTEAREYHQRALTLSEETGDRVMVGVSQMNIGRCASLMEEFSEASIWFNAALGTLERTKFWNGLTLVYEHMAEMYLRERRAREAMKCIDNRIELAARHGNKRMESEAWEQRARAYEQLGKTNEALEALKKSVAVSKRPEPYESVHRYLDDDSLRKSTR